MGKDNQKVSYCTDRKCPNTFCLRHNINMPYNVRVTVNKMYGRNNKEDQTCKYELTED